MINEKYTISEEGVPTLVNNILNNIKDYKLILLNGEIGSGKTFFVKELAKQLGEKSVVNSPSFQIINIYDNFVHIDAYNLESGLEQYYDFFDNKIVIIEWASNLKINFKHYIEININYLNNHKRLYEINEVK